MTRYQLAKIVQTVGTVDARKRLQKVIYLLTCAGCPLDTDYDLHLYGPYSHEIAKLTDEMVIDEVLKEERRDNAAGHQYSYSLSPTVTASLTEFEKTERGAASKKLMDRWNEQIKSLAATSLWTLELASTIAYFKQSENTWEKAIAETAEFKNVSAESFEMKNALKLATSILS